jgi:hypothetical protein
MITSISRVMVANMVVFILENQLTQSKSWMVDARTQLFNVCRPHFNFFHDRDLKGVKRGLKAPLNEKVFNWGL